MKHTKLHPLLARVETPSQLVGFIGKSLVLVAALFFVLPDSAGQTQEVAATVPQGYMTYEFPETTTSPDTVQLGISLTTPPIFRGTVDSVTSNTVTFAESLPAGVNFAEVGKPYFMRIISGQQKGRAILVTSQVGDTLTLDITDNSSQSTPFDTENFALVKGDKAELFEGYTLASLLGDNTPGNPLVIVPAGIPLLADTVGIFNKGTARHDVYFFSTTLGHWQKAGSAANSNGLILYPESGVRILRRANRDAVSLIVMGEPPSMAPLSKMVGSNQFIHSRYPMDITLGELQLSNWTQSDFVLTADTLGVFNENTGKFDVFYQRLDGAWRKSGDAITDQSGFVIKAGTAVGVVKRTSTSGVGSYLSAELPYTLE